VVLAQVRPQPSLIQRQPGLHRPESYAARPTFPPFSTDKVDNVRYLEDAKRLVEEHQRSHPKRKRWRVSSVDNEMVYLVTKQQPTHRMVEPKIPAKPGFFRGTAREYPALVICRDNCSPNIALTSRRRL
jgi:hypothetical protein